MAGEASDDCPADYENGAIERQRDSIAPAAGALTADHAPTAPDQTAQERLDAASLRDEVAETRDRASRAREHAADALSDAMAQRDTACQRNEDARALTGVDMDLPAAEQRRRAARYRRQAAAERAQASQDRQVAAHDRDQAARERLRALLDREALARQLAVVETDGLTGARTRAAGLIDLEHELDRCRETSVPLVLAYVDVVALVSLSDGGGDGDDRGAGDTLLTRVVAVIKEHLRSFDLIIRLDRDEFLCAMSNMSLRDARERFSAIASALAGAPRAGAIRTAFAQLTPGETATELIARAERQLIDSRRATRSAATARAPAGLEDASRRIE